MKKKFLSWKWNAYRFWKPWICRKTFLIFSSDHIAQERFWNWLEFIHTSESEIQQLQNICLQLWFQNLKKSTEMKLFFWKFWTRKYFEFEVVWIIFSSYVDEIVFSQSIALEMFFGSCRLNLFFFAFINLKYLWQSSFWKWIFAA